MWSPKHFKGDSRLFFISWKSLTLWKTKSHFKWLFCTEVWLGNFVDTIPTTIPPQIKLFQPNLPSSSHTCLFCLPTKLLVFGANMAIWAQLLPFLRKKSACPGHPILLRSNLISTHPLAGYTPAIYQAGIMPCAWPAKVCNHAHYVQKYANKYTNITLPKVCKEVCTF